MNKFPLITTQRLLLRNFNQGDVNAIYDLMSNPAVTQYYDLDSFTHMSQAEEFVESRIDQNNESGNRGFRWAICLKSEPNIVIGSCGFHATNKAFSSIEIGFELSPSYWGKSIVPEALKGMLGFCFTNNFPFPINRVSAITNLENTRSIHLLGKLGFVEEGIMRQYGFWKNEFHDVRLFSLLKCEWQENRDA